MFISAEASLLIPKHNWPWGSDGYVISNEHIIGDTQQKITLHSNSFNSVHALVQKLNLDN